MHKRTMYTMRFKKNCCYYNCHQLHATILQNIKGLVLHLDHDLGIGIRLIWEGFLFPYESPSM